ncbi:MAG: Uma2 family endonuclease [Gemmataceae bacterium]|nr:Uma2 family endonuclease [Gemmataceae bacterium]
MATVATKAMTAEGFFDFVHRPENRDRHFELEDGEIVEMSLPGELHGVVCGNIVGVLGNFVRKTKRGRVCSNGMGLIMKRDPDTVRGPDISLYLDNKKYQDLDRKYPEALPALIVEVLSPNDRPGKTTKRLQRFLAKGVPLAWMVDPESRDVSFYRPDQAPLVLEEDQEIVDVPELPDFRCRVAELFEVHGA